MICSILVNALALTTQHSHYNEFAAWKSEHGKTYQTYEDELNAIYTYIENDRIIQEHNAKNLSWTLGHNVYSDLTWDQFRALHLSEIFINKAPKNVRRKHLTAPTFKVPESVDWVAQGAVTPVKNQGQCGSCWSFSTTGAVEGAYQVASGKLLSLSEQQLVSCDTGGDNAGCKGGLMQSAFEYIEKNGITTEAIYPYTSGKTETSGTCDTHRLMPRVTVTSFTDVPPNDEAALKAAIARQPVSVAIEADKKAFQLYKSGILDSSACGTKLDHGVLAVGYGTDGGKGYYKVKNSWGATWGESGYIRMVQGKNMCGIALQASYPTGAKAMAPSPSPSPSPSPAPSSKTHYGDPNNGCRTDETELTFNSITGDACAPTCRLVKPCPTDVPNGVSATPECALQDGDGVHYCALICSADAECGDNASCKPFGVKSICTYDA